MALASVFAWQAGQQLHCRSKQGHEGPTLECDESFGSFDDDQEVGRERGWLRGRLGCSVTRGQEL